MSASDTRPLRHSLYRGRLLPASGPTARLDGFYCPRGLNANVCILRCTEEVDGIDVPEGVESAEWDGETIISAGESMNQNGIAQLSSTSTGVYHKLAR